MTFQSFVPSRRGHTTAPLFWVLLVLPFLLSGCYATKKDVRTLQEEINRMQARQDQVTTDLTRQIKRQNRILMDSVEAGSDLIRTVRGQLSDQIREMRELILTVQQLLGQSQQRIAELRQQLDRQIQQQQQQMQATQPSTSTAGDAEDLYRIGMTKRAEGAAGTARAAFEELLKEFPNHTRAPDAQLALAETYVMDGDFGEAYKEFDRVSEMYPTSDRAPDALLRAGNVAEEQRNNTKAREYYNRVTTRYPESAAARLAKDRLAKLRR